ncbi:MAG: hypothetical protein C4519_24300 [Desulfobacteraceae bacterium]|nr:MAG: hypothetical protein C4519_24300 [Desulfobacteraceae bacterium]
MKPSEVIGRGNSLIEAVQAIEHVLDGRWAHGKKFRIVNARLTGENLLYKGKRVDEWTFGVIPLDQRGWTDEIS